MPIYGRVSVDNNTPQKHRLDHRVGWVRNEAEQPMNANSDHRHRQKLRDLAISLGVLYQHPGHDPDVLPTPHPPFLPLLGESENNTIKLTDLSQGYECQPIL